MEFPEVPFNSVTPPIDLKDPITFRALMNTYDKLAEHLPTEVSPYCGNPEPPSQPTPAAVKYDQGKPRMGLIPRSALVAEAQVMGFGAAKYGDQNWRKGMAWSRLIDAALRHIYAFADGENLDPESQIHHLGHARCCLAFLLEYAESHPELDDRFNANREETETGSNQQPEPS